MSEDLGAPGALGWGVSRAAPSGSGVSWRPQSAHTPVVSRDRDDSAAFRGTTPAFDGISPVSSLTAAREPTGTLAAGGLYVGAEGIDPDGHAYRLVAPLDRGGMGELFIAEVEGFGPENEHAVIKRLLPDLMDDRDYVEMFRSEAAIMGRLHHPSVVKVLGTPEIEGAPCLALELVVGRSVQQLVSRSRRLAVPTPPALAAYVVARVASALDHVHHARAEDGTPLDLVHRDVSPGNILLGFEGEVKLTDFGIAKSRMSAVSTTVGIVKGKARYLAPEQILGKPASPRSDLFSSAVVLVELLTGKPLFERGSIPKTLYAIVHGERGSMKELLPRGAAPLAKLLERALATSPDDRPPSAMAFAQGLEQLLPRLGPPVDAPALGKHLRGVFAGTQGPLTRSIEIPPVPLSPPGAKPLDPSAFSEGTPVPPPGQATPLPLLEPVEAPGAPRSAPHEVDQALSVLAWLQSRDRASVDLLADEPKTVMAAPLPRRAAGGALGFATGLLAGLGLAVGIGWVAARSTGFGASLGFAPLPPLEAAEASGDVPDGGLAKAREAPAVGESSSPATRPSRDLGWSTVRLPPLPTGTVMGPPAPPVPIKPAPARLEVLVPRKGRVYLDGKMVGRIPYRQDALEPGEHTVTIKKRRFERILEVLVRPGELVEIGRDVRRELPEPTAGAADAAR